MVIHYRYGFPRAARNTAGGPEEVPRRCVDHCDFIRREDLEILCIKGQVSFNVYTVIKVLGIASRT